MLIRKQNLIYATFIFLYLVSTLKLFANTYVVDVLTDGDNLSAYTLNDGTNTLRKCIRLANANAGADIINFEPTLSGTIALTSNLITITEQITIDGTTALGAVAGTPTITIDGVNSFTTIVISVSGGNSIFNTLCIIRSSAQGIYLNGGNNNTVKGCYIGINISGVAAGNLNRGIYIRNSSNNIIGGATSSDRNIISGNAGPAIRMDNGGTGMVIKNNYIGVGINGSTAIGNSGSGIDLVTGANTIIGGIGVGNIISANGGEGIKIGASNIIVQGNYIGTNASGANLGNAANGVHGTTGVAAQNIIVGFSTDDYIEGEANTIAYNVRDGVNLESINQTGWSIKGNSIYCNANGNTIDLGSSSGQSNGDVPAPIILSTTANTVSGTCVSGYVVHIYRNTTVSNGCGCWAEIYVGKAVTTGTTWRLTHNLCLADPNTISAIQTDPATENTGVLSTCASQPLTIQMNNAPVAMNDSITIGSCDEISYGINIDVAANDSDTDGDSIEVTQMLSSLGGTATILNDSTVRFISNTGISGMVSVSYVLCDKGSSGCSSSMCDTATIVFNIPVNNAPVAMNDTITTCIEAGKEINIDVTANDSDIDGDSIQVTQVISSTNGTTSILNDSTIKFIANSGSSGQASISYELCDKGGTGCPASKCDTATIVICLINSEIFIPNLITPGNDSLNNTFEVIGLLPNSSLMIFNRWGSLVFLSENYSNDWKPANSNDGIYFYYLKDIVRQKEWKGWIHVINESK